MDCFVEFPEFPEHPYADALEQYRRDRADREAIVERWVAAQTVAFMGNWTGWVPGEEEVRILMDAVEECKKVMK